MDQPKTKNHRVLQVPCIECNALQGQPCVQPGRNIALVGAHHAKRVELADKLIPHIPNGDDLDATDKALIAYYAFILLADSVAANSMKTFGKEFSSEEIQKNFCHHAIEELKKGGLLS